MSSAAYPTVYNALVSVVDAALSVRVVDGYDVSNDPGDVVMIGVPSLSDTTSISAGSFSQVPITLGTTRSRDETGSINGIAMAWSGDTADAATVRATAFGYIAAIEAALRSDPALGVTAFPYLVAQMNSGDVAEDKVDGATCAISFTVTYKARI